MPQQLPAARADTLRAALDSVFAAPDFRWERPQDPFGLVRRTWLAILDWFQRLQAENPAAFRLLLWGLIALLVVILAHGAWVAFRTVRGSGRTPSTAGVAQRVLRDAAWYGAEAQRLAREGRYVEAMQTDFVRLVLELDARRVTRFHPSKTPGEYVREAALPEERRRELRDLVRALYAHAFARVPCDGAAFSAWHARAQADRYAPAR